MIPCVFMHLLPCPMSTPHLSCHFPSQVTPVAPRKRALGSKKDWVCNGVQLHFRVGTTKLRLHAPTILESLIHDFPSSDWSCVFFPKPWPVSCMATSSQGWRIIIIYIILPSWHFFLTCSPSLCVLERIQSYVFCHFARICMLTVLFHDDSALCYSDYVLMHDIA